jgi:hypothetical protein
VAEAEVLEKEALEEEVLEEEALDEEALEAEEKEAEVMDEEALEAEEKEAEVLEEEVLEEEKEEEEGPDNFRFCTLYFRRIRRSSCQGSLCRFACSLCGRSRSSRSRSRRHSCCRQEACHWGNESLPLKKSCRHRPSSVQPQSQGRMSLLVRYSVATAVRGPVLM